MSQENMEHAARRLAEGVNGGLIQNGVLYQDRQAALKAVGLSEQDAQAES